MKSRFSVKKFRVNLSIKKKSKRKMEDKINAEIMSIFLFLSLTAVDFK